MVIYVLDIKFMLVSMVDRTIITDVSFKDNVSRELMVFVKGFYIETKEAMIDLASEAVNSITIPRFTGELEESFEIDDMEESDNYGDTKTVIISNIAPHAKFVNGPTKPHFVTFKHHPELRTWADTKLPNLPEHYRGLFVYKSRYPQSGGQFMDTLGVYVDERLKSRVEQAIDSAITAHMS